MSLLRHVFNGVALVGGTVAYSIPAGAALIGGGPRVTRVANRWARFVNRACGIDVTVEGLDQEFNAPAYLVMANHSSHTDLPVIFSQLELDMRPVAKRSLGHLPVFGWVLRAGAAIMIDRGDPEKARLSIEEAAKTIRGGRSVLMFPEGTRSNDPNIAPLKKGPFYLAMAARVPVLPVGIVGTGDILESGDWRVRPGKVSIHIGTPIQTADLPEGEAGRDQLRELVRVALVDLVARGHIDS